MAKTFLEIVDFTLPAGTSHISTDWQLDDTQTFTPPILIDNSGNTTNLLDNSLTQNISGSYYGRARINLNTGPLGWTTSIIFSNPNIPTPDVYIEDTDYNITTPTIKTSGFVSTDGSTHQSTDWYIVDTATRQTVYTSLNDTANLTSLSTVGLGVLTSGKTYRVYARFKSNTGYSGFGVCEFTCNVSNNIEIVNTNVVTVTVSGGPNNVNPLSATISAVPVGIVGHTATDWVVIDRITNNVVWESLGNTTNLTSITVPGTILTNNNPYTVLVRYKVNNLYTDYGRYDFTTVSSVNTWTPAANYPTGITEQSQSTLSDGRVLVVGGIGSTGSALNTCHIYDPATNTWSPAANYPITTWGNSQSTLSDGRVLVVGGCIGINPINICYIYDPATNTWTAAANYPVQVRFHSQSTLSDGRVLVVGGNDSTSSALNTCRIYDPATNTWSPAANYPIGIYKHSQSTLLDGRVLVVGGRTSASGIVNTCHIYDPATDTWSPAANYPIVVGSQSQSTLLDGRVLVVGGSNGAGPVNTCHIYDPTTNTWSPAANYPSSMYNHNQSTLLDGRVLVVGGTGGTNRLNTCNIYIL